VFVHVFVICERVILDMGDQLPKHECKSTRSADEKKSNFAANLYCKSWIYDTRNMSRLFILTLTDKNKKKRKKRRK
jgi:hypothetical protein